MGLLAKLFGPPKKKVQPVHVTDANYLGEVFRSDLPVLVDVWSPGCGPCAMLEPIVMQLAADYEGRVKVVEVNAAEAPEAAARLGVMGTPTVVFFKGRREVERVVGFVGERFLREIVETDLLSEKAL
ncbi:MAG: thioredoxin domain-containing protein [Anaeromyxobacter sp.]